MFTDWLSNYTVCTVSYTGYFPPRVRMKMSHSIWRTRAAQGAGAPAEKLTLVSESSVEVRLLFDVTASLRLTLRQTVSTREHDGREVVQEELTLSCKACTEVLYRSTLGVVRLEDLSEARTTGQFHLSECTPKTEADTEVEEEEPLADQEDQEVAATPELPRRTYCD